MKGELAFHSNVIEFEEEFRNIRRSVLEKFEAEMEQKKQDAIFLSEAGKPISEQRGKLLKELGFDPKQIEKMDKADAKISEKFLAKVRPRFIEADSNPDQEHRKKIVTIDHYQRLGGQQPVCLGVDMITSEAETVKSVKKAAGKGNPGVWFYDPSDVQDVKTSQQGTWYTSACGQVVFGNFNYVTWWYSYYPQQTQDYWFLINLPYKGFWVLEAHDNKAYCKHAEAEVSASVDILQNGWLGEREIKIFDKHFHKVNTAATLTGSADWDYYQHLVGGQHILIKLQFFVFAEAKGSGSYAEMNFAEGAANKIGSPVVIIGT